jgi:hypothetical protein
VHIPERWSLKSHWGRQGSDHKELGFYKYDKRSLSRRGMMRFAFLKTGSGFQEARAGVGRQLRR